MRQAPLSSKICATMCGVEEIIEMGSVGITERRGKSFFYKKAQTVAQVICFDLSKYCGERPLLTHFQMFCFQLSTSLSWAPQSAAYWTAGKENSFKQAKSSKWQPNLCTLRRSSGGGRVNSSEVLENFKSLIQSALLSHTSKKQSCLSDSDQCPPG